MRFYSMILVVCLVLLGAIGTSAQEKPSFTGTWKMNLEKSTLSDGKPIPYYTEFIHEIDHKEPKFRLTEKIKARPETGGDRTVLWDVTTDGKEYETTVGDAPAKVSVSWNNNQLVQRIAGEDWQVVRTSSLASDGRTITADWVLTQQGNTQRGTEVWEKQ
jgi:hypothetical protein